ncbi:MAG: hypothetical protein KY459_08000 [Acidobacteria bacterium]|nr:hypothetical protein [Acidobacteriota bacterium]
MKEYAESPRLSRAGKLSRAARARLLPSRTLTRCQKVPGDTPFFTLHSSLFTLHSSLFTLHSSLLTLHSSLFTLHSSLFSLSYSATVIE